ncbi:MAG: hypothetical protein NTX76_04235 [Alphaproteobacteria bacterium]|nr:hypothetical protein [Alphaproteobacteria bacterium]
MLSQTTYTELAGNKGFKLPTIAPTTNDTSIKSPEWMVKIDGLMSSSVVDYTDHCELLGWFGASSRQSFGDISPGSATIKHSDLILKVPNGGYGATLETNMYKGIPLDLVQIVRLGNIQSMKVKLQVIDFKKCFVQLHQQELGALVLYLRITVKTNTIFVYDVDGNNKGQIVSEMNYAEMTAQ